MVLIVVAVHKGLVVVDKSLTGTESLVIIPQIIFEMVSGNFEKLTRLITMRSKPDHVEFVLL